MSTLCEIPKVFCNARDLNNYCLAETLCEKVIDKCFGCNRIENDYCQVVMHPAIKWRYGNCAFASHVLYEIKETKKVNPLKLSKKSSRK